MWTVRWPPRWPTSGRRRSTCAGRRCCGRTRCGRALPGAPDVLARRRGLLPSTIAHAAWGLLLARCAGTPDAVFGTTVSGRPAELPGVTERVGMFVNTVPVRVAVDGELPVGPWLAAL